MNWNMPKTSPWTPNDELNLICYLITRRNIFKTLFFTIENLQLRGQYETLNRLFNVTLDYAHTLGLHEFEVYELFYMLYES
jgi:hypothetical protein